MTGLIKTMAYTIVALMAIMFLSAIVGAFVFGMGSGITETNPTAASASTPTQQEFFTPHGRYAEYYIPPITEIGDGTDWYMTKKETKLEGMVCTATYIKDEHRTVVISISVCPTVDGAKSIYTESLTNAPYVECPTMGVCDQSFQYVEKKATHPDIGMYEEVGTGVIRDGNIIVIFKVFEDNMFFGINSYDMERYAKNIEKKIN